MKILQLSVHYSPNVGGVETHLSDLVAGLAKRGHNIFVLSYQPLVAKVSWKMIEKIRQITIFRIPYLPGFFYKLVKNPLLEFIYLIPGLFIITPCVLIFFKPDVIHTHGLVAGYAGVFWGKIFRTKVITTTHSIYHFPKSGLYRTFSKWIFNNSHHVLTLSKQSKKEIERLGVSSGKIVVFTYWVDLNKFRPIENAKKRLGWKSKCSVLYVGRLVEEKGILILLESLKSWNKDINLAIVGIGPLEKKVSEFQSSNTNLKYYGGVQNGKLPLYYSAADIVIIPSIHEEGFGRVILESLACGTPVIAANRGAIPEAMDDSVGRLIDISANTISKTVNDLYTSPRTLERLSRKIRNYALKRFSSENLNIIIKTYTE